MFEIVDNQVTGPVIKVIGVGGAGGNAVNHMIEQGVKGVEFLAVNTDAQVLSRNKARNQIQLGTSGLGAGAKPEEARAVALADRDRIEEAVAGSHMVFITAGMGGEQEIACPLLEGVNLAGARGVLVNITASKASLKLRETKEVMNIIRTFAAEDATIIYGGVFDDGLAEDLRVTVVATGLGLIGAARQSKPQLVHNSVAGQQTRAGHLPGPGGSEQPH